MSNIRGLGDIENNSHNPNRQRVQLLGTSNMFGSDPRKETFPMFIRNFCCPLTSLKSFIFFISLIDVTVYIVTLCFGIGTSLPTNPQLLPPLPVTLEKWSLWRVKLRENEMWRWLTYAFVHADFVHIFSNVFSQFIIGPLIERLIGSTKMAVLYFSTAILGALFAVLIDNNPSVGASIAIYGLLGAYIGFSLMNWNFLDTVFGPVNKCLNLFFIFFVVLLNFSSQINNPLINSWGHLGGLLTGFFLIFILTKPELQDDGICCSYKIWLIISSITISVFTVTGFTFFYLFDNFKN